jgi:hypothetical protein
MTGGIAFLTINLIFLIFYVTSRGSFQPKITPIPNYYFKVLNKIKIVECQSVLRTKYCLEGIIPAIL